MAKFSAAVLDKAYEQVRQANEDIPLSLFMDTHVYDTTKKLLIAHADSPAKAEEKSEAWHALNNRFIAILDTQKNSDSIRTAKRYTTAIDRYIQANVEMLLQQPSAKTHAAKHKKKDGSTELFGADFLNKLGLVQDVNGAYRVAPNNGKTNQR